MEHKFGYRPLYGYGIIQSTTKYMPNGNSCRLFPLLPPMQFQDISIYLSYSQDAVTHLPRAIAKALEESGFTVFLNEDYFSRFNKPDKTIIEQIRDCTHFVCLITPATLRCGFGMMEQHMPSEIQVAHENNKDVIILLAYDKQRDTGWGWGIDRWFPANPIFCDISIDDFDCSISRLAQLLTGSKLEHRSFLTLSTRTRLQAEYLIDKAITEEYEAIFYNRKSSETLNLINQAIKHDPQYAESYFHRAEYYRERRHLERNLDTIINNYTTAIHLDSSTPRFYHGRASIYERKHTDELALKDYTKAIQLAPCTNTSLYWRAKNIQ